MSRPSLRQAASLLLFATLVTCRTAQAEEVAAEPAVHVYATTDGTPYFAMNLVPNAAVRDSGQRDVVVLFDTSASQTGLVREKAMQSLAALLDDLDETSRVRLFAIDLEAVPMSQGFAPPRSEATRAALETLKQRVPLGATDLPEALRAAMAAFEQGSKRAKVVIFIGDGLSSARYMSLEEYRSLVDALADAQVSISSYAIGARLDSQMMACLANQTGGMLVVDREDFDPKQVGAYLAKAARGTVLWPSKAEWPKTFAAVFPRACRRCAVIAILS